MNLQNLRVFLKVAELEHVTRAAEELGLSQPAVTKTIQSLEHEVGMELVERQGRRIALTHAGRVLQNYTRQLFALERQMEESLDMLRDVEGGEVMLAANTTTGVYVLPAIVARFRTSYPHVHLKISILNSHEIVEKILDWRLDFGLVEGDPLTLPTTLNIEPFAKDELVLVLSPDHYWSTRKSIEPELLGHHELVMREVGSGIRTVVEHALLKHQVSIHPLFTLTDNEAIKQMVMHGVGAAIVSRLIVAKELERGELIQLPIDGVELHAQLSLVQRADKQLSRAALAFRTFLKSPSLFDTIPANPSLLK